MNLFKDVINGLLYEGRLPENAVSSNQEIFGLAGQAHLSEPGAAERLDKAKNSQEYHQVLKPKVVQHDLK
jgi:hypothetical protein